MKRVVPIVAGVALLPVGIGYGLARALASYFENPRDILDRIADDTIECINEIAAGYNLDYPPDGEYSEPNTNEGSCP